MKSFIVACLILLLSANTFASDKEQACGVLSTWVHSVIMLKVQGAQQSQVLPYFKNQQPVGPALEELLTKITTAVYSPNMPPITSGADIAAIVSIFYDKCLKEGTFE